MKAHLPVKICTSLLMYKLSAAVVCISLLSFTTAYSIEQNTTDQINLSQLEEDFEGDYDPAVLDTTQDDSAILDTTQEKASVMLIGAAEWFDSFFDDSRFSDEENRSVAKIRISNEYHEEDGYDFRPSIRWRIHLPRLSKKANLIIFAREDPEDDTNPDIEGTRSSEESFRESFAAGIQYFLRTTEKYNLSTTFGGSFNYLYAGMRFRYYKDLGPWQSRFVERLRYYTDDGWENYVSLDFERHISAKWLFRASGDIYWRELEESRDHYLSFRLFQFLSENHALSYEWINKFDTEPSHELSDLTLRLRYRQKFLREWLIFEIAPQVNFPEEYDNDPKFGINFTIEAKFGNLGAQKIRNLFNF